MKRVHRVLVLTAILAGMSAFVRGQTVTETFTSNGTFVVPGAGVTSVTIWAWGAGGAGGGRVNEGAAGGGGGGAFAASSVGVNPGEVLTITVAGTTTGTTGDGPLGRYSQAARGPNAVLVRADGGVGGLAGGTGGRGGAAAVSIGTTRYAGGNGASAAGGNSGGGGGGAGTGGAGGNASGTTAGTGTAVDGGNGGAGRTTNGNGNPGSVRGGGGGGARRGANTDRTGGAGAGGEVRVSYTLSGAAPDRIAFLTPARTVYHTGYAYLVRVELRDASNNTTTAAAATTLNLSSSLGGTFRDAGDTADITSIVIPAGQWLATFRYRPNVAGSHDLTVSSSGLTSALQTWQVNATPTYPSAVQTFYLPLPEEDIRLFLNGINSAAVNPMQRYAAITTVSAGTVIYYDQRENGYEAVIDNPTSVYDAVTNPSGTQIWGDGDPANGYPPGFPEDQIPAGAVILLNNSVDTTSEPTVSSPRFHGGDKIASSKAIAVTTTVWASDSNTLFTDAVEVYDLYSWGTDHRVPVGEDIAAGDQNAVFERVGASIMAGPAGATVQIDADANGTYETTVNLTEGSAHLINGGLSLGARFLSDNPVQVDVLTGDVGSNYESRWFRLLPTELWTNDYFTPVSTPYRSPMSTLTEGILTSVWLYNPNASAITVTYQRRGGSSLIRNVSEDGTAYTAHPVPDSAYGNVVGPIFALNDNGTAPAPTPEGAWIGIVNRNGTYTISTQVQNAQAAGAAALIVHHNVSGSTTFETAGTGRYIPVVGVTLAEGNTLRAGGLGYGWVRVSGDSVSSNISVPAGGYARVTMENGYGGRFFSTNNENFYAVSTTDTTGPEGNNQAWDWGFTLVPRTSLTSQLLVGLGIGRDHTYTTGLLTENGSPVWVSTVGNESGGNADVTVYVDYDSDPTTGPFTDPNGFKYDLTLTLRELETVKVYNPSGNQSGMLLYTLASGVKLVGAWGQDPQQSSVARPGLDMGTGIPPLPQFTASKKSVFIQDNDGDGYLSPLDDLAYELTITNISRVPVDDLTVQDTLPAAVDYLANTTTWTDENGVTTSIPDNGSPPIFPLAPPGIVFSSNSLPPEKTWTLRYEVRVKAFPDLPPGTITFINAAIVNSLVVDDPIELEEENPVYGRIGDRVWLDADADGLQDGGEIGIPNVTVRLYDGSGTLLATTTTDATGWYTFYGLLAGNYRVEFDPPPGLVFSPQNADSAGLAGPNNSDPDPATGSTVVFALAGGQPLDQVDAGLYVAAVIGDRVWLDEDGDGVQDAGEDGIANVRVELLDSGNNVIAATYTDTNGGYLFTDVPAGAYTVRVDSATLPAGLAANPTYDEDGVGSANQSAVTVSAGTIHLTSDFGYNWAPPSDTSGGTGTGAIGDRIWVDADGDGIQDPGEPGLGGVTVQLYRDSDANGTYDLLVATTTTDAAGNYIFDGLAADAYVVIVNGGAAPAGYTQTGDPDYFGQSLPPADRDNRTTTPIVLAPGDVFVNADFGYQPDAGTYGSIGDRVWLDADADGVQDGGEPGIPNITVTLIRDTNGNGVWDAGEPIVATTDTDANGEYLFAGVPTADGVGTDDYLVWVNDTAGILKQLQPTYDFDGPAPGSGIVSGFGISAVADLAPAGTLLHDFGYTAAGQTTATGLIGDTIFLDLDNDGAPDAGEGLAGVTVRLYASDGTTLLGTTATDANGNYYFGGLPAGTYVVRVATSTLPNGGAGLTNTVDPDGGVAGESSVTLASGQINLDQDFGYRPTVPNTIGGTIWEDRNADGTLTDGTGGTPNETGYGVPGVTVALYDSSGHIVARTVTDANGNYSFTGLPDGTYRVDVTDEANVLAGWWHSTGPNPGQDNNSQSDPYTVSVAGGQTNTTADFGYYFRPGALGNRVWFDVDGDGRQDPEEPGLAGAVVRLKIDFAGGTTISVVTTTDSNGFYSFGNLLLDEDHNGANAGTPTFTLSVDPIFSYYHSPPNQSGVPDSLDSDPPLGVLAFALQGVDKVPANSDPSLELPQGWYDFGFTQQPTLAVISEVRSRVENGVVTIEWDVEMEVGTQGYYLERWTANGWSRVNASLLPVIPILPLPKTYAQADPGAPTSGVARYRILEMDGSGRLIEYGPYDLEIGGLGRTYEAWAAQVAWNGADGSRDADPDGDGATNFQEWLAGTDPLRANSVLAITEIEPAADGVRLKWTSVAGRTYAIEMTTDLRRPFVAVATGIAATPPKNERVLPVDFGAVKNAFFRVRVGE